MFEKVLAGEHRRRQQRNRHALAVSALAHVLVTAGAARLTVGPVLPSAEEVVSYVDLPVEVPDRTPPAPPQPPRAVAPAAEGSGRDLRDAPPAEGPPAADAEPMPDRLPEKGPQLAMPVALVAAPAMRLATGPVPDAPTAPPAAAGEVVDAEVLAERPRLANRWEMEQVCQELYPRLLEMRGITGETVVSFVIDERGRVLPATVELISASRAEFGEAVLLGVARLRFRPMRVDGVPVRVRTRLPVLWTLRQA